MNTADLITFLKEKVVLFKEFSDDRLQTLVAGSQVASFEARQAVMHHGTEATHFGIVLNGKISISRLGDGGTRQALAQLAAGNSFNEMALMTGDPVAADFIAESRVEVLLVPVSLFKSIIMSEPGAVQRISRTITARMKTIMSDPAKTAATLGRGDDPYGLNLKGERPEKMLIINCGSSSLKYSFYDIADDARQASGAIERIGIDGTKFTQRGPEGRGEGGTAQGRLS